MKEELTLTLGTFAEQLGWTVLHSLWQGAVIAALLALALRVMRGRSAAVKHAMCMLALPALLAAMAMTMLQVRSNAPRPYDAVPWQSAAGDLSMMSGRATADAGATERPFTATEEQSESGPRAALLSAPEPRNSRTWIDWLRTSPAAAAPLIPWISALWAAGVLLLTMRHLGGWWRVRSIRASATLPLPKFVEEMAQRVARRLQLKRSVPVLASARATTPLLLGVIKPAVLLPASVLTGLRPHEVEALIAHELAHFARGDAWANLFQLFAETILFYHPAVWWIGRCARIERENAADDLAVRTLSEDRLTYASALARLAEMSADSHTFALAASGGSLIARIRRILREPSATETANPGWLVVVALAATTLTLLPLHAQDHNESRSDTPVPSQTKAEQPSDTTNDAKTAAAAAPQEAKSDTSLVANDPKAWVAEAFQIEDLAKRSAAIERIRQAMTSTDEAEARTGVQAFVQLAPIEFDKASFRPVVRSLISSPDPATRASAATAFTLTGAEAGDLPRIFALADDPSDEVRSSLTYTIMRLVNADVTARAASDAILKLMADLPNDSRAVAHALWGAKLSPEIEARVLEFCREIDRASNSSVGYNFFYGTLSTQANKSEASCKRLIELLAHPDTTNIAGRAAWGLQQGVSSAQFQLVADAMMKVIESRSDGYLRPNALRCLNAYGGPAQVPALRALLAKAGVNGEFRDALEQTLARIEQRPAVIGPRSGSVPETVPTASAPAAEKIVSEQGPAEQANSSSPAEANVSRVVLHVMPDGSILWDNASVTLEALGEKLQALTKLHPEFAVVLRVGSTTNYKSVSDVLEVCRKANISKLTFAPLGEEARKAEPADVSKQERAAALVQKNREAARLRAAQDRQHYTPEQLREIETLYQVANTKGKRTEEARASLKQLLEKYDKANRTGCATLYLGHGSEGEERLNYLTTAIEKFSDCYYFNGCQVGGYGRYVLALTLWERGDQDKARALLAELKTTYKDATDHSGRPMGEVAAAVEKELDRQRQ